MANNTKPGNPAIPPIGLQPYTRLLIIFIDLPIKADVLSLWRTWAIEQHDILDLRVDFIGGELSEGLITAVIKSRCSDWHVIELPEESPKIVLGNWIDLENSRRGNGDPSLLSMMFGSMGKLLNSVDITRRRFNSACDISTDARSGYLKKIRACLSETEADAQTAAPDLEMSGFPDDLPRVLLLGETGVGKTLFARYLAHRDRRYPEKPRFEKIHVPEYLGKEDMLEYELFGYAAGSYTGGKEHGSLGLLLRNVGGVIFLDEIGDANSIIQAKLLAYLDDFKIRPRGWNGEPFFCPTMVIAATNRNFDEIDGFRTDLVERFTDVFQIPPIRERKESLPFILDGLLQRDSINPERRVMSIGEEAYRALFDYEFRGNFRELENLMRRICEHVRKEGRDCIYRADFELFSS